MAVSETSYPRIDSRIGQFIDHGADSRVQRIGDLVVKTYYPHISLEQAKLYADVTNKTVDLPNLSTHQGELPVGPFRLPYAFSITPIDDVFLDRMGRVVGVSRYIPGPRVEALEERGITTPFSHLVTEKDFEGLSPDEQKAFLVSLFEPDNRKKPFSYGKHASIFDALSKDLRRTLGVKGISIVSGNVKALFSSEGPALNLVITDLCPEIKHLR